MGIFDKIKEPVFVKTDSEAEKQLAVLKEMQQTASGETLEKLNNYIQSAEAGIYGEKTINFELANSHIPMCVLHDLFLEYGGLTAQIDYLLITRKHFYVLECKNLYGNIEITSDGSFIRSVQYGKYFKKEGIYSPVTQNRRHLDLIKQIRTAQMNSIERHFFENSFYDTFRSVVVLANPKTVVNMKFAKKEIREQVIKADRLIEYIRTTDANSPELLSEKDMKAFADYFLSLNRPNPVDYTEKFKTEIQQTSQNTEQKAAPSAPETASGKGLICPECGAKMIKRVASKGQNAGKAFYGCSAYPKCRCIINIE